MFTGIIETMGTVGSVKRRDDGALISIEAPGIASELSVGESVSVNGACLSVVEVSHGRPFWVEAVPETLERTTLGWLNVGDRVNLERSLRMGERLSGHLVLGHVDGTGEVTNLRKSGPGKVAVIRAPSELTHYIAFKGSVAVDGVSLTVSGLSEQDVEISLIPHTLKSTIVGSYRVGTKVNIEIDIIARYLESLFVRVEKTQDGASRRGVTLDFLKEKW
ncbi:MAG: riboflavin synthase [Candidatus Eiseniibacteriota bacterium]|nr:MAG: riboflavin synthase [Candidatus Eisenbacteria bacterium]